MLCDYEVRIIALSTRRRPILTGSCTSFVSIAACSSFVFFIARVLVHGLYTEENDVEIHFIINRRITPLTEWLEDNRGHQDVQEFNTILSYASH